MSWLLTRLEPSVAVAAFHGYRMLKGTVKVKRVLKLHLSSPIPASATLLRVLQHRLQLSRRRRNQLRRLLRHTVAVTPALKIYGIGLLLMLAVATVVERESHGFKAPKAIARLERAKKLALSSQTVFAGLRVTLPCVPEEHD